MLWLAFQKALVIQSVSGVLKRIFNWIPLIAVLRLNLEDKTQYIVLFFWRIAFSGVLVFCQWQAKTRTTPFLMANDHKKVRLRQRKTVARGWKNRVQNNHLQDTLTSRRSVWCCSVWQYCFLARSSCRSKWTRWQDWTNPCSPRSAWECT